MIWPYRAPGHCPSVHLTFYTDLQCTRTLPFSAPGHWQSVHLVLTYNAPGLCLQCTGTSTYCTLYSAPGHWPSVLRDLELQCTWAMPHSTPRLSLRYTENRSPCNWTLNFSASDIDLQCTWTLAYSAPRPRTSVHLNIEQCPSLHMYTALNKNFKFFMVGLSLYIYNFCMNLCKLGKFSISLLACLFGPKISWHGPLKLTFISWFFNGLEDA